MGIKPVLICWHHLIKCFTGTFLNISLYVNRRGEKFLGLLPESEALPLGKLNLTQ